MELSDRNPAAIPRPEYPRPQFVREQWMNLNGQWDFLFDFGNSGMDRRLWEEQALTDAMAESPMPTAIERTQEKNQRNRKPYPSS